MLLQPPHKRGSTVRTAPAPRKKARRLNSKVTVSYTTPTRTAEQASHRVATPEDLVSYSRAGITEYKTAIALFKAGVTADAVGDWTAAGVSRDDFERMTYLSANGVTPQKLKEYPIMRDTELISMVATGTSAPTAHAYGHAMDICCGARPGNLRSNRPYPAVDEGTWGCVSEWARQGKSVREVGDLYKFFDGECAKANVFLMYGASVKLLDHLSCNCEWVNGRIPYCFSYQKPMLECQMKQVREEWKKWVEAAEGRVSIAKAVCDADGDITDVRAWMRTGEPIERIELLASTGIDPYTLDERPLQDLTEDDLRIWSELTNMDWS